MRSYVYHSNHPRFPGSIEEQKKQYPGASWLSKPTKVLQTLEKFKGSGGWLVGIAANGDQIQEHHGVLVTISMSVETWNSDVLRSEMSRVSRAKALKARRTQSASVIDITNRMVGEADNEMD